MKQAKPREAAVVEERQVEGRRRFLRRGSRT
jgi:hypothetical protein